MISSCGTRQRLTRALSIVGVAGLLAGSTMLSPLGVSAQHSGWVTSHPAAFVDQGTVTMVTDGSAADLDPASEELASSDNIDRNIGNTLVDLKGSSVGQVVPSLAQSWTITNGGKRYIFNLRHGVYFHTGHLMTSADVVYSLTRTIKAGLTNSYLLTRFISNPAKQIRAVGKYRVEIDLSRPQQFLLLALADSYVCMILDSKALKAHAKGNDYGHAYATSHDLGTGPYRIQSWQHNQQVTLVRFPRYWGGWSGPHFSKVVVQTVPESSSRRELLERGQADLTFDLTPQDYRAMQHNSRLQVSSPYGTEVDYIQFDDYGKLKNPAARQALSYAFDYNALLNGVMKGFARRATGPYPHVLLGYNPHGFTYQTNLSKAKALFARAGIKAGATLTMDEYPSTDLDAAGLILQAQLSQIGIKLQIKQMTEATYNGILYGTEGPSGRPDLMPFGWWPDFNDPYDMAVPLVASWSAGANGANGGYYKDSRVDSLLKQMETARRSVLVNDAHELQNIVTQKDPAALWLVEPAQTTVLQRKLKGYVFNPLELQTYNFYTMHH